ncbi:hypothetical protein Trydic_g2442 [Trypoxylus dichotomus]
MTFLVELKRRMLVPWCTSSTFHVFRLPFKTYSMQSGLRYVKFFSGLIITLVNLFIITSICPRNRIKPYDVLGKTHVDERKEDIEVESRGILPNKTKANRTASARSSELVKQNRSSI